MTNTFRGDLQRGFFQISIICYFGYFVPINIYSNWKKKKKPGRSEISALIFTGDLPDVSAITGSLIWTNYKAKMTVPERRNRQEALVKSNIHYGRRMHAVLVISDSVSAATSVRSPHKLFILITKKHCLKDQSIPIIYLQGWRQHHCQLCIHVVNVI